MLLEIESQKILFMSFQYYEIICSKKHYYAIESHVLPTLDGFLYLHTCKLHIYILMSVKFSYKVFHKNYLHEENFWLRS